MGVEDQPSERIDDVEIGRADSAHVDDERLDGRMRTRSGRGHDDLLAIRRRSGRELIAGPPAAGCVSVAASRRQPMSRGNGRRLNG